ncbi:putative transmembrane protein [Vibrio mediterranei AK1]|uniref:DMT family transporter n=1 Tax=Vibrio mediterranei TaxID=689 RepID=UPI0001540C75|nr:DMT family transporter [Vibrio mediterranei]EDL54624.1 putative transmembrane protein [Vibrio mediterranei AK1]
MNKNFSLALTAMTAFALNSLFCRFALGTEVIDPVGFTLIRLVSGAVTLVALSYLLDDQRQNQSSLKLSQCQSLSLGLSLFGYALLFSFAYITLDTGTGALILFGTVQLALIAYHRISGHEISKLEMVGIAIALTGFASLLLPSASQPSVVGTVLMVLSGVCWSIFTILGKRVPSPILATKQGFLVASGFMILYFILSLFVSSESILFNASGALYAVLSGSLASAVGYFLWYSLLPKIDVLDASLLQLTVPVIAMVLGWLFIGETVSAMSLLSTFLILGGIGLVSWFKLQRK